MLTFLTRNPCVCNSCLKSAEITQISTGISVRNINTLCWWRGDRTGWAALTICVLERLKLTPLVSASAPPNGWQYSLCNTGRPQSSSSFSGFFLTAAGVRYNRTAILKLDVLNWPTKKMFKLCVALYAVVSRHYRTPLAATTVSLPGWCFGVKRPPQAALTSSALKLTGVPDVIISASPDLLKP